MHYDPFIAASSFPIFHFFCINKTIEQHQIKKINPAKFFTKEHLTIFIEINFVLLISLIAGYVQLLIHEYIILCK